MMAGRRLMVGFLYGFGLLTLLTFLLSARLPWVRLVYGLLVGGVGIVLLATGRDLPRRFEEGAAASGAFRFTGAMLIVAAAGGVAALTFPRTPASVVVSALALVALLAGVFAASRYPELSVFWEPNGSGEASDPRRVK
jgi:hypothetical protein